jgi:hypothetical protein
MNIKWILSWHNIVNLVSVLMRQQQKILFPGFQAKKNIVLLIVDLRVKSNYCL